MTLQQLRYFVATCQHGSFTAAADALFVAQPSVAEQVRRLEAELGVRLFVRTGRKLQPTEAGARLRVHADRIMLEIDAAKASVQGTVRLESGTASLGTFGTAHRYLTKQVVATFVAQHPAVAIRVVGLHSFEVAEKVRNGELEAGLVCLPIDEPSLVVEPVMSDEVLFVGRPGPDTDQPMPIRRFAELRTIMWGAVFGWRDSIRRSIKAWADDEAVPLEVAIEVEHPESALELVQVGLGAGTYLPRTITGEVPETSGLATVSFERPIFETYAFVRRRDHALTPATQALVQLTRTHLEAFESPPVPRV